MRIRLSYFLPFIFALFLPNLSFAAPTSGGFTADAVLAMKPQVITDTSGILRWNVPVSRGGLTGVATIAEDYAVGRILMASRAGTIGLLGLAAVEAAKGVAGMCIWDETKWHDCTQRPTIPITIDTSKITPATATVLPVYKYRNYWNITFNTFDEACASMASVSFGGGSVTSAVFPTCTMKLNVDGSSYTFPTYYFSRLDNGTQTIYSCSSGSSLTNSSGAPMAVTGQSCTPLSAYTCPSGYFRSDSSGNTVSDGMFCSYTSPVYTDADAAKILAPYLLDYYANQLFTGKDGKPLDVFSAPDTTFDPAVTPSTMPMTWEQLKNYVDWVRNGLAQTTDPLAPHYITPNNYDYTKNYINTNNTTSSTVTNNTSSATSTITPEQTASSAAMTQTQYEESNKKADTEQATALNAAMNPLTNVLTQYNADKQFMIDKITSPTEPPAAMPDIFTWAWPTGQCQGFTLKFRVHVPLIGMLSMDKLVNEHCPPYNEWAHPALFWFFNIVTGLYLFRLWDKTAAEVVRI